MKKLLVIGAASIWASAALGAHTGWLATLSPSQEAHVPSTTGSNASCIASFRAPDINAAVINTIFFSIRCVGLSSPITAIHLHGPADADSEAAPLVTLFSSEQGTAAGAGIFTTGRVQRVVEGDAVFDAFLSSLGGDSGYVNVHTLNDPAGAVRGQVVPAVVPNRPQLPF